MNERAVTETLVSPSVWRVDDGCALFAGPLQHNDLHRHSVPVFLAGLYDRFRLRIDGTDWTTCRSAVVPAGTRYEFDMRGDPLAVVYVEPDRASADALTPLVADAFELGGAFVGHGGETATLRTLYENRSDPSAMWALKDLMQFYSTRARRTIDVRIARAVAALQSDSPAVVPVRELAALAGLSSSRFQHLFTEQVGVPYRRYRAWNRLRTAIREVIAGANYTTAAHAAGFADQAHFSREFRRTFGGPASRGLRPS